MDDIWDEPATISETVPRNEPLFLPSDDEEQPQRTKPTRPKPKNARKDTTDGMEDIVGDMFDDLLDGNEVSERPDMDALLAKRAKNASKGTNQVDSDSIAPNDNQDASKQPDEDKDAAPKGRRTIAKVDDERLIGERGFPALIKESKKFKPKGKGHEVEDLDRLLGIYQFWAHNMFPKTQFRDTVDRVERVCRSRRMQINMGMWRDAERPNVVDQQEVDPNKSDESDAEPGTRGPGETREVVRAASTSSPPAPTRRVINLEDEDDIWNDMDDAIADVDMNGPVNRAPPPPKPVPQTTPDDDDLEDWFNADSIPPTVSGPSIPDPPDQMDIDEPIAAPPKRYLSPPTADNWDEDLYG